MYQKLHFTWLMLPYFENSLGLTQIKSLIRPRRRVIKTNSETVHVMTSFLQRNNWNFVKVPTFNPV